MPRKFLRFVPKGASRKGRKVPQPSSSSEYIEIVTSDSSTQTESPEMKDACVGAEEAVVITSDAFTQTDEISNTEATPIDELAAEPIEQELQDHLCEGNNDTKFHPLIIRYKGVFTNVKGMY